MTALLEVENITVRFGDYTALRSASLRAYSSQITALMGRNGAGKSTLLNVAAGLIAPHNGTLRFSGQGYLRFRLPWLARHGLMFIPARDVLHKSMTLRKQLEGVAMRFGEAQKSEVIAEQLNLSGVWNSPIHKLSGGEMRRAGVAFAIARAPRVLLIDEPLRGVSPIEAESILSGLQSMAALGCAVVITGHEFQTLLPAAHRVTWCHAGSTQEFADVATAMKNDEFERQYRGYDGLHTAKTHTEVLQPPTTKPADAIAKH